MFPAVPMQWIRNIAAASAVAMLHPFIAPPSTDDTTVPTTVGRRRAFGTVPSRRAVHVLWGAVAL
jgi:hypothetical protein